MHKGESQKEIKEREQDEIVLIFDHIIKCANVLVFGHKNIAFTVCINVYAYALIFGHKIIAFTISANVHAYALIFHNKIIAFTIYKINKYP